MASLLEDYVDSAESASFFGQSGWSGKGLAANDERASMVVDQNLTPLLEKKGKAARLARVSKRPAVSDAIVQAPAAKRPARDL